jgi:hypothetical protein
MSINIERKTHQECIASVVLSVLVDLAPRELGLRNVIIACERDSSLLSDKREIRCALRELVGDGLVCENEGQFSAARQRFELIGGAYDRRLMASWSCNARWPVWLHRLWSSSEKHLLYSVF